MDIVPGRASVFLHRTKEEGSTLDEKPAHKPGLSTKLAD
jgi:hypothetical protein